ncbi:MAG: hypothetical protein V3T33_04960 [Myxococcota bacterium]
MELSDFLPWREEPALPVAMGLVLLFPAALRAFQNPSGADFARGAKAAKVGRRRGR